MKILSAYLITWYYSTSSKIQKCKIVQKRKCYTPVFSSVHYVHSDFTTTMMMCQNNICHHLMLFITSVGRTYFLRLSTYFINLRLRTYLIDLKLRSYFTDLRLRTYFTCPWMRTYFTNFRLRTHFTDQWPWMDDLLNWRWIEDLFHCPWIEH